ncbi:MAG UNVERIFIED_CONTAM: hypothetical protein LVR18_03590 [Planctomycetaceae bacterium]|jgi:type IV secretion system protein VirB4
MAIVSNQRKSDKNLYNRQTEEYIPISCHYDPYTLLTKNGELLQVISIPGILSDNLSYDLREVTQVARISLAKNIQSINVGCWIHNIRRKRNIDDSLEHSNIFSKDLHNEWAKKHNLKSSFTNCLYITVIMKGLAVGLNDVSNIIASTSSSTVIDKHEAHLQSTSESLNLITQSILKDLDIYGAEKLGLKFKNGIYYSDLLSLYNHLCNLNEHDTELPIKDLSEFLSIEGFAIGSRQIEVVQGTNRNFASILSIKEYHNSGQENLLSNLFLAPIEFIATEIFIQLRKIKCLMNIRTRIIY